MFSTAVRGEKAFAAEQKLRELKKRVSRLLKKHQNKAQITKHIDPKVCRKYGFFTDS